MIQRYRGQFLFFALAAAAAALLLALSLFPFEASAQYDPTRGIASSQNIGCSGPDCQACNLVRLGNNVITFLMYAGTIAAALIFAYAGIKIAMSGDNSGAIAEAKSIMLSLVIGFFIMLSAWLAVDTALKALLSDEAWEFGPWNEVLCVRRDPSYPTPPPPPPGSRSSEQCTRNALTSAGIGINKGACATGASFRNTPGGCTTVADLPREAVDGLIRFKNSCTNCGWMVVTGGTEAGHATHGPGRPIIDIGYSDRIRSYLAANGTRTTNRRGEEVFSIGGATYTYETNPPHFHIVYPVSSREPYTCAQAI